MVHDVHVCVSVLLLWLQDALGYLLPTRLTARDARPSFKVGSFIANVDIMYCITYVAASYKSSS